LASSWMYDLACYRVRITKSPPFGNPEVLQSCLSHEQEVVLTLGGLGPWASPNNLASWLVWKLSFSVAVSGGKAAPPRAFNKTQ
jgi:hypothetical protein